MTGITQINYGDAQEGRIRRRPSLGPDPWFEARGAKYMGSNEFVDESLELSDDHFQNVRSIVRSARKQNHDGVEIRLNASALDAVQFRVAELAAIENVEVEACFYGEHRGKEKLIARFRERAATWLLERAKATLTELELKELQGLVSTRLNRSAREIELTLKALGESK